MDKERPFRSAEADGGGLFCLKGAEKELLLISEIWDVERKPLISPNGIFYLRQFL